MKLNASNNLTTKIAHHVKMPCIDNSINAYKQKDTSYKHINNTMYRMASKDYVCYFYNKNNLISYYRQSVKKEGILLPNSTSNTYKFVEFEKDKYYAPKPLTVLAKSINKNWCVISINTLDEYRKNDVIITNNNIADNIRIEHIKWDPNILKHKNNDYVIFHYPIYKDIFIVLFSTKQHIVLYFFNIPENKFDSLLWGAHEINRVVFDILNNSDEIVQEEYKTLNDNVAIIRLFVTNRIKYLHKTLSDGTLYVHGLMIYCVITLEGDKYSYKLDELCICIVMEENSLKCYWDFSEAKIQILESIIAKHPIYTVPCEKYLKDPILFMQKYVIQQTKNYNDILHNDKCYYIKHLHNKKAIIKTGSWLGGCEIACMESYSVYYYKNYYIIINEPGALLHGKAPKLIIADKENDFIGIIVSQDIFPKNMWYIVDFEYYYLDTNNKLVFLSKDLNHLFIIEAKKIDDIFNSKHREGCKDSYDGNLGLIHYCSIPEQILRAVNNTPSKAHETIVIELAGSYIDRKSNKLYIGAKYRIENTEYYGLFAWDMANSVLNFKLIYTTFAKAVYNNQKNKIKYFFDISKLGLWEVKSHGFRRTKLMNLDILYSEDNRFVSVRYNRISRHIPVPNSFQYKRSPCKVESVRNAEKDVVVVYYDCNRSYPDPMARDYFYFILSHVSLVRKIPVLRI